MEKSMQEKMNENKAIEDNLVRNTDILDVQFESFGLKVSTYGYSVLEHFDYWLDVFIEVISSNLQPPLKGDYEIGINLYNANGNVIGTGHEYLEGSKFSGFSVCKIEFQKAGIALMAHKARIFIIKV
jgi:hypothetical protein